MIEARHSFLKEDRVALVIALALHAALAAVLVLQATSAPPLASPRAISVNLATEVSLEDAGPAIVPESRAALAPELADTPTPPPADAEPQAEAGERALPEPAPSPRQRSAEPRRESQPQAQSEPRSRSEPAEPRERARGSRISDDFLSGSGNSARSDETRLPASRIGASARASLQQAINRQLKPHWTAPSGLEAERLVTILAFRLNEDGSLAGPVRVVRQDGITDANARQAPLHAERAKRAVQRAAPFDLPIEYYEAWKNITQWRFDRRL